MFVCISAPIGTNIILDAEIWRSLKKLSASWAGALSWANTAFHACKSPALIDVALCVCKLTGFCNINCHPTLPTSPLPRNPHDPLRTKNNYKYTKRVADFSPYTVLAIIHRVGTAILLLFINVYVYEPYLSAESSAFFFALYIVALCCLYICEFFVFHFLFFFWVGQFAIKP